ncbi:nuclear factor of kappa light polypeptide gene enhancer in B-cells inhibitor, alpha a [Paramormyrops kingsleyae]|uniref:NF-kappa-B inhibitor alpha n=1 Tax=Paramormyrops kingsleyae TaxID=1676925 RepID=A0A3B3QM66_9TELE|nr:NF-kappa-B inhibitor alpha-like [Paramormyrops kingsleyae]
MALCRVYGTNNQMDYETGMDSKKVPCSEDRLDSGLDSLKEELDSIVDNMDTLRVDNHDYTQTDYINEPWKLQRTEDGDTILHLAVIHEAKDYVFQIINRSRNEPFLNVQNNQRQTALHLAVITEQADLVDTLLKAGCDPQLVDDCGNTALHIACKKGSLHCFSVLTQYRPQHLASILAAPNYSGHNCLHIASIFGFLSLVESLIQLGADVNAQEYCNGRTALHLAVDLQNLELVKLLVAKGANVNSVTYGGYTAYHLTYGRQSTEIQQQLHALTAQDLRELPESDEEDSDEEPSSEEEDIYDDIFVRGQK